jgi:hypothetical protein
MDAAITKQFEDTTASVKQLIDALPSSPPLLTLSIDFYIAWCFSNPIAWLPRRKGHMWYWFKIAWVCDVSFKDTRERINP